MNKGNTSQTVGDKKKFYRMALDVYQNLSQIDSNKYQSFVDICNMRIKEAPRYVNLVTEWSDSTKK